MVTDRIGSSRSLAVSAARAAWSLHPKTLDTMDVSVRERTWNPADCDGGSATSSNVDSTTRFPSAGKQRGSFQSFSRVSRRDTPWYVSQSRTKSDLEIPSWLADDSTVERDGSSRIEMKTSAEFLRAAGRLSRRNARRASSVGGPTGSFPSRADLQAAQADSLSRTPSASSCHLSARASRTLRAAIALARRAAPSPSFPFCHAMTAASPAAAASVAASTTHAFLPILARGAPARLDGADPGLAGAPRGAGRPGGFRPPVLAREALRDGAAPGSTLTRTPPHPGHAGGIPAGDPRYLRPQPAHDSTAEIRSCRGPFSESASPVTMSLRQPGREDPSLDHPSREDARPAFLVRDARIRHKR